jgi:hypothetical protein
MAAKIRVVEGKKRNKWVVDRKGVFANNSHIANRALLNPKKMTPEQVQQLSKALDAAEKAKDITKIRSGLKTLRKNGLKVGEHAKPQVAMDMAQVPLVLRGAARQDTRNAINTLAASLLTNTHTNPTTQEMHDRLRKYLTDNSRFTHVRIRRSRTPMGVFTGPLVVEALERGTAMGDKAEAHYKRFGYTRHRSGEGDLILSRGEILTSPLRKHHVFLNPPK